MAEHARPFVERAVAFLEREVEPGGCARTIRSS